MAYNESGFSLYGPVAVQAARDNGLDPALFVAQIGQESNFDPEARSGTGVRGIAQITQALAKELGIDRLNPVQAIQAAARYDAANLAKFGGDTNMMLAAYNAGPGAANEHGYDWSGYADPNQVQGYVAAINAKAKGLGDMFNDGVIGQIFGRNPDGGVIQDKLKGAQDAAEGGWLGALQKWVSEFIPGLTIGIIGIVLIFGALLIFAKPYVEKAAKVAAKTAAVAA